MADQPPRYEYTKFNEAYEHDTALPMDDHQNSPGEDSALSHEDPQDRLFVASIFLVGVAALTGCVWWFLV
ncbi:hypothetical protein DL546_005928 [Coniochaeta pulveracea]|uniref:Uncharacterized protein n=1 Tax=Coniochaeta pulveracea TaxID=177199 RepID=A0A420YKT1_9PEZI|nr:hypothetical protein DL546_005928 [Coniochaeta pulveracea]